MIVNIQEFISLLYKINNESENYDQVIVPYKFFSDNEKTVKYRFKRLNESHHPQLNYFRTVDPIKLLFYLSREKVFPVDLKPVRRIILGVKACDLKALKLLDTAMLENGFVDPAYKHWREHTLIISADCDYQHETCTCNLTGGKPFPEEGFDLNLSVIDGNFFIHMGSSKADAFIELMKKEITVADPVPSDMEFISINRQKALNDLKQKNNHIDVNSRELNLRKVDLADWESESRKCVGCGACTNICPTCYCIILNDESVREEFSKVRSYDSCQWNGYARVAGGGTTRPEMTDRFRNRYLCKFDYMQKNFGSLGCTGCGRCTEACAAGIDFRAVIRNLNSIAEEVT